MGELRVEQSELEPLVKSIVKLVLREIEDRQPITNGQIAFDEGQAAEMLGLKRHQLRDLRLEKKISHSRIVGRRIRYTLKDLQNYLSSNRYPGMEGGNSR